jgi:hypothetical protein
MKCLECDSPIYRNVYEYSIDCYGVPLCRGHQDWINKMPDTTTDECIRLYFFLKHKGIAAEIEKFDGYKSIDIVIESAKLHIEVDGGHHNFDKDQALKDLQRTYYSFQKGYFTLRIPNSLLRDEDAIERTSSLIMNILKINQKKTTPKFPNFRGRIRGL